MKKQQYSTLLAGAAAVLALTSCGSDFLDTNSSSVLDRDFVFSNVQRARSAMDGVYDQFRNDAQYQFFGDGLYYAVDIAGSDIERHPEPFEKQPGRHWVENLQANGEHAGVYGLISYSKVPSTYSSIYDIAARCSAIIAAMESSDVFNEQVQAGEPTQLTQLYGEAVAMRATVYRLAIPYWGDMPYATKAGEAAVGLAPRDSVYECMLDDLRRVEPLMYDLGANPDFPAGNKNYMSRTYVDALIGRICLDAAGYQTRRNSITYVNKAGEPLQFEKLGADNNDAFYGRRTDWKDFYAIAKTYYELCLNHLGTAVFHTSDPRAAEFDGKRVYGNPYQYFFQQMHDADDIYADESIYEYPMQLGVHEDARAYSLGRVSGGGETNNYPCKNYGQCRANPAYYFGAYDNADMRRDVTWSVTGSSGNGTEAMVKLIPGSKLEGGITLNKWDDNRQPAPWWQKQRLSGINGPYMRISEVYLSYAEVCEVLGDAATAKRYLELIRNRAFPEGKANTDAFIEKCGGLFNAIIEERGFEFAGDGDRRWTLLRTGLFPETIRKFKELTKKMLDGVAKDGYYTFENGNQISAYIWTKLVDAKSEYGYRLTTQCPAGKEDDPVLFPGWRGQHDAWESFGLNYGTDKPKTNLAIKGLFRYIDPNGPEAAALEADGYEKVDFASPAQMSEEEYWRTNFQDYDYVKAPIYMFPFPEAVLKSGGFTNGYGFKQTN